MYDKCVLGLSTGLDIMGRSPVAPFGPEAGVDLQWKYWQSEDMLNGFRQAPMACLARHQLSHTEVTGELNSPLATKTDHATQVAPDVHETMARTTRRVLEFEVTPPASSTAGAMTYKSFRRPTVTRGCCRSTDDDTCGLRWRPNSND